MIDQPLARLKGAGPVTAARLAERGLHTVGDLLAFLPRGYDDYRTVYRLSALADLPEGTTVVVEGTIRRVHLFPRRLLDVHLEDDGARLSARWFRPPSGMAKVYAKGMRVAFAGTLRRTPEGEPLLVHPIRAPSPAIGMGVRPRYPQVTGVPGRRLETLVASALEQATEAPDPLPAELLGRLGFPSLADAFRGVHRPDSEDRAVAQRRLLFDDMLAIQLALAGERHRRGRAPVFTADVRADVRAALPFALTRAQDSAIDVIFEELASGRPMHRLLQGDVGSGKTAVVFAAALLVARAGAQTLLMAPTELLAEQHVRTLQALGAGLRVGLLTGSTRPEARRRLMDVDVLVGTHALAGEGLPLRAPALAVIDEQHRFGVEQRSRLCRALGGESAGMLPHLLVLSATPIPRTLALTVYGDLDLTLLDEMPPGRRSVMTHLCVGDSGAAYAAVQAAVRRGEQAFVICPAVAGGQGRAGVLSHHPKLVRRLAPARVGLVHGQMPAAAQEAVLRKLRDRALDVLVATTVLEVGVDVPAATVMVIENADRFGLAQLHQLRGRVGRSDKPSSCWLCLAETADAERVKVVVQTNDGFQIAEEDLRRRGPGELFGSRQSGAALFDLSGYTRLVETARAEAETLLANDPELTAHPALRALMVSRISRGPLFAAEAG